MLGQSHAPGPVDNSPAHHFSPQKLNLYPHFQGQGHSKRLFGLSAFLTRSRKLREFKFLPMWQSECPSACVQPWIPSTNQANRRKIPFLSCAASKIQVKCIPIQDEPANIFTNRWPYHTRIWEKSFELKIFAYLLNQVFLFWGRLLKLHF